VKEGDAIGIAYDPKALMGSDLSDYMLADWADGKLKSI
jgi:hypothetical protein